MAGKKLVIVESPTKAKTITKFLGKDFDIVASNGHIRDLPNSATEIPAKVKGEAWTKLGINIEKDFEPLYIVPPNKKDNVKRLKEKLAQADLLYLATDEDREGESISWHLLEELKPKVPVKRLVFHEITKDAINRALESARSIDENLVKAQETRRIVDRLFGYQVSPILWKKMSPGLSAGRVQSVAIRLLVERERERIRFKRAQYWSAKAVFAKKSKEVEGIANSFEAELTHVGKKRVASGKDFDPKTGKLLDADAVTALNETEAKALCARIEKTQAIINSVDEKPFTSAPPAPFVTSTLQQEGNRKLRLTAKRTMSIAQQLYENGFITYMRTDSTTLSEEALNGARTFIKAEYGNEFLPEKPRLYATKVKNAQEAHEAIRPAGESFTSPEVVKNQLGLEAYKLYDLIWKRTVASQMTNARGTHISVQVQCDEATFRASGKTIEFPGFLRAYVEGSDDPEADLADQEKYLPKLSEKEAVDTQSLEPTEHTTQPPPRFTEGSLIKELERLGIGRPSTWATIVELVLGRSYAFKRGNALVPTFVAMAVVGLLEKHFTNLLDYAFTARLEDDLDAISRGEAHNIDYLKTFYFGNGHPGLATLVKTGETSIDPREVCGLPIGSAPDGRLVEVRIGRYGPFISNGEDRASVPDSMSPDDLTMEAAVELLKQAAKGPEALGMHPETGEPVYLKVGRFGPYVQQGENSDEKKAKMASLLAGTDPLQVTLEHALQLLSLPRTLGTNPADNEPIIAANGRYGPYIMCGKDTRSITEEGVTPLNITFEQAIELLKQPKQRGRGRQAPAAPLRDLGKHPVTEKVLLIKNGRFGPYVTDGEINASLQRGSTPETLTLEEAVHLLEERARKIEENGGVKKKRGGKATKKAAPKPKKEKKEAAPKKKKAPAKKKASKDTDDSQTAAE